VVTELTTKRLELRPWRASDLDEHAAMIADPEVGRYVGGPTDRASAWRQIAEGLAGAAVAMVCERRLLHDATALGEATAPITTIHTLAVRRARDQADAETHAQGCTRCPV
jgi:hypothetical protein